MKIIHICPAIIEGDGVSNCALYLSKMLDSMGYENVVAAQVATQRDDVIVFDSVYDLDICADDIVLYSFSYGTKLNTDVEKLKCKKILIYQNVTPPQYFRGYDFDSMIGCLVGQLDAQYTVGNYIKCITPSEFSKNNLIELGWDEKDIEVVPLISKSYKVVKTNKLIVEQYDDGYINLLFVGRIVPNKKIEDVIQQFDYFKKNYHNNARLILVGSTSLEKYYGALLNYIHSLGVSDVIFTGKVSEEDLASYYRVADVFLCMSEHEGLCLPILEAMKYEIPVVAYKSAAIPDTMGNAGVVIETKNNEYVSGVIENIISNEDYRRKLIEKQKEHQKQYCLDNYRDIVKDTIDSVVKIDEYEYCFERQKLSAVPFYEMGTDILFGNGFNSAMYCTYGFAEQENWGTWTSSKHCGMEFQIHDVTNDLELRMKTILFNGMQDLILYANGCLVFSERLHGEEAEIVVDISRDIVTDNTIKLRFELPQAKTPKELGMSDDQRRIALGFKYMKISEK